MGTVAIPTRAIQHTAATGHLVYHFKVFSNLKLHMRACALLTIQPLPRTQANEKTACCTSIISMHPHSLFQPPTLLFRYIQFHSVFWRPPARSHCPDICLQYCQEQNHCKFSTRFSISTTSPTLGSGLIFQIRSTSITRNSVSGMSVGYNSRR
jgi:hypothetical protein